jgi:AbiJ N-terminal domain 3
MSRQVHSLAEAPNGSCISEAGGLFGGTNVGAEWHSVGVASLPGTAADKTHGEPYEITPVTRRDAFDLLRAEKSPWWERLNEIEFLGQLYDLDALPSTDPRHATAGEDIARHRVANFDWDDDWIFSDQRFQLADGPDRVLLDFLALMAHPWSNPTRTRPHGWWPPSASCWHRTVGSCVLGRSCLGVLLTRRRGRSAGRGV